MMECTRTEDNVDGCFTHRPAIVAVCDMQLDVSLEMRCFLREFFQHCGRSVKPRVIDGKREQVNAEQPCAHANLENAASLIETDKRVDGCLSHTSIVRYDAYEDAGGHQSASLAFLDAARSGVIVSAIQGRDYARIYVKELDRGRPSLALSPEEQEAVERAMAY